MPCPSIAAGIVGEISSISLFYFHPSYTTVKLLGGGGVKIYLQLLDLFHTWTAI